MRYAGPIRKDLGVPTIFNLLGPLTNPAGARSQLIGVPNKKLTLKIAKVLKRLGAHRVLVVNGNDGLCELTVTTNTHIAELRGGEITEYEVNPLELGLKKGNLDDIRIRNPEESAKIIKKIFDGTEKGTARDIALINAAGALVVAGLTNDLKEGLNLAKEALDSGNAEKKMTALINYTQKFQ